MFQLCNFFVFIFVISTISADNNEVIDQPRISLVDQLIKDYLMAEEKLWGVIERREPSTLQQIYDIHTSFLQRQYGESNVILNGLFHHHGPQLTKFIMNINDSSHDIAREFFEHRNYTVLSMKAFEGISLDEKFRAIYELTANSSDFWSNIRNWTQECEFSSRSIQFEYQVLFEYYQDIQAASLRTYITVQLSYMILHLHESGDFHNQSIAYRMRFREIDAVVRNVFKNKLVLANRDIWTCDPLDYTVPGASYEITNFLQGYIDAEVNLNAEGSCALTCGDYQNTKHYACNSDTLCAGLKPENRTLIGCKGKVRGCHGLDDSISVCPADGIDGARYKYVKSETGLKLGNDTTACVNELKANAWTRWFVKCSNCFCYCDDITNSDRYFSLQAVTSDIRKNRIVTGLSLTKRNGVIQFEIAERQLNKYGHIDNENIEYPWKFGDHFEPNDNYSRNGVDYHTLSWEQRSLNLDVVIGQVGTVVTGIRFRMNRSGHLYLEVRFTEYNKFTGELMNLDRSFWLSNANGGKHRINTDNMDIPTKSTKPSIPSIKENSYVRFGPTHKRIDLSQRTVPFIDGQKVEPKKPAPLSGIGLYYKSQSGFGGFVAPKLILNFDSIIE